MNESGTSAHSDILLLFLALPFAFWAAWTDLKEMRITNRMNLMMAATFVLIGWVALPFAEYGLRLLQGLGALVIGFILNMARLIGGGDAKYIAAFAPFIALADLPFFLLLLAVSMIAAVIVHAVCSRMNIVRQITTDWVSFSRSRGKNFPMGFALSGALMLYLTSRALNLSVLPG